MFIDVCKMTPVIYNQLRRLLLKFDGCSADINSIRVSDQDSNLRSGTNGDIQDVTSEVYDVLVLLMDSCLKPVGGMHTKTSADVRINIICKNSRYMVFDVSDKTIPMFVFILSHRNARYPQRGRKFTREELTVFSFNGVIGTANGGAATLIESLWDPSTKNERIIQNMRPFRWRSHNTCSNCATGNEMERRLQVHHRQRLLVRILDKAGHVGTLEVCEDGIKTTDNVMKEIGALRECLPDKHAAVHKMSLAENDSYKVIGVLCSGTFSLELYNMEDILTRSKDSTDEVLPLLTLSHSFHFMGCILEARYGIPGGPVGLPRRELSDIPKTDLLRHTDPGRIDGMLRVMQAILRRQIPAIPIRAMGENRDMNIYRCMQAIDITRVLHALGFVSDDESLVRVLNRAHGGSTIVRRITKDMLLCRDELTGQTRKPDTCRDMEGPCSDFRLYHSSALSDAISHQNVHIMKRLIHSPGLNIHEVATALYSGISFCYSYAYTMTATEVHNGQSTHVINQSDFPIECDDEVKETLSSTIASMALEDQLQWTSVSHNFCVQADVGPKNYKIEIECHTTEKGLIFFRHRGEIYTNVHSFIGAVYIPPEIIQSPPTLMECSDPVAMTPLPTDPIPPHPDPVQVYKEHSLVLDAIELATEVPSSKETFFRNATKALFLINAICVHSKYLNPDDHKNLRAAWLDTYTHRAVKLCGGVHNLMFCDIFAHLGNLEALPLRSVGYWANTPYV
jgi:hypothetical protein